MTQKQALKAAKKRGLVDKKTAAAVQKMTAKPKRSVVETGPKDPTEAHWAVFKKFHGACPRCKGGDPFCGLLMVRTKPNGEKTPDLGYFYGQVGLAIQELRRAEHRKREPGAAMSAEVKEKLREVSEAKKAARSPRRTGPTTFQVCAEAAKEWATKDQIVKKMMATAGWERTEKQTKQLVHSLLGHHLKKRGWTVERNKKGQWRVVGAK